MFWLPRELPRSSESMQGTIKPSNGLGISLRFQAIVVALFCVLGACELSAEEECITIVLGDQLMGATAFMTPLSHWVEAGMTLDPPPGGVLAVLTQPAVQITSSLDAGAFNASCVSAGMSLIAAQEILSSSVSWVQFVHLIEKIQVYPWEDMARSGWPVFELTAAWAARYYTLKPPVTSRLIHTEAAYIIWYNDLFRADGEYFISSFPAGSFPSSEVTGHALFVLLAAIHDLNPNLNQGFASLVLWALAAGVLGLSGSDPLVTPGYALRLIQMAFVHASKRLGSVDMAEEILNAPWPLLSFCSHLAIAERTRRPSLQMTMLPRAAENQAGVTNSNVFAPVEDAVARQLAETLHVAHNMLESLGVRYIAIAGTLLGAIRHFDRIPWDDDVDLCVDNVHEFKFLRLAAAEEAIRLGKVPPLKSSWRMRRALRYLKQQNHVLKIVAARSLTFRVNRVGWESAPVDIWLCFGLENPEIEKVAFMSDTHGPRIPRSIIFPRRKIPFGHLAVWAPANPEEVTRLYLVHGGFEGDFMQVCRGQTIHGMVKAQYNFAEPCATLHGIFTFAKPWVLLDAGEQLDEARSALVSLFRERVPGLAVPQKLQVHSAGLGTNYRLRVEGLSKNSEHGQVLHCQALMWQGMDSEDDVLHPGSRLDSDLVVRSLTCGELDQDPSYAWEDVWS